MFTSGWNKVFFPLNGRAVAEVCLQAWVDAMAHNADERSYPISKLRALSVASLFLRVVFSVVVEACSL